MKKKIDRLGATAHPQRGWRKAVALVGLLACVAVGKERSPPRAFSGRGEVVEVGQERGREVAWARAVVKVFPHM